MVPGGGGGVKKALTSPLYQTNLNDGPGPRLKVVKVCSQSGPNKNPKNPFKDI